jgi:hypothetical protein
LFVAVRVRIRGRLLPKACHRTNQRRMEIQRWKFRQCQAFENCHRCQSLMTATQVHDPQRGLPCENGYMAEYRMPCAGGTSHARV